MEVLEPSVIFEAKDGKYGEDGSETLADNNSKTTSPAPFLNSLGDLKKNIEYAVAHPEEMKIMSQNCMDCANNKFNRPKQIKDLNKFLEYNLKKWHNEV